MKGITAVALAEMSAPLVRARVWIFLTHTPIEGTRTGSHTHSHTHHHDQEGGLRTMDTDHSYLSPTDSGWGTRILLG